MNAMDSALSLAVSALLSSFGGTMNNGTNSTSSTPLTNGTVSTAPAPAAVPTDLSGLLTLLFSFSALRDWLKLIVIGGVLETCRRFAYSAYDKAYNYFFITAQFDEDDSSYDWMMVWLSKQPSWSKARQVEISTRSFGLNSQAVMVAGEEDDASTAISGSRKLAYLPSKETTYSMFYKRRWMTITRQKIQGYYGRTDELLEIRIMTRSHKFLGALLLEAKREYIAAAQNTISVYVSDSSNNWRHVASRPKRPLRSIVLDPGMKDLLIDDARDFLESKSWYAERGIPFRRGYLLYGAPGSGKTSIIHSLAGELGLDVYVISLSRTGLDDTSLGELISELPEKCIALMEDIDAAFHQGVNRDSDSDPTPPPPSENGAPPGVPPGGGAAPPRPPPSRISLSGLLNALDGVGAQEGRILFATTNKYNALDPALCRPGRMDLHVEFKLASKYQCLELFMCFYDPSDTASDKPVAEQDRESEKASVDSGYSSSVNVDCDLIELDPPSAKVAPKVDTLSLTGPSTRLSLTARRRVPQLSRREVSDLASRFAECIPEREFSMASLQGYLMGYKTRPHNAVKDASSWVEGERMERAAAQKAASVLSAPVSDTAQMETSPPAAAPVVLAAEAPAAVAQCSP